MRLLYQHGRFTAADTRATGAALSLYALGLVGYTGVKVLAPAFYALGRPRVPLLASALGRRDEPARRARALPALSAIGAIALGTALGSLVNVAVLLAAFERRVGGLFGRGLFRAIARMLPAAVVMGAVAWGVAALLEQRLGTRGSLAQLATGLVPVALGVAAYGLLTRALRRREAEALWTSCGGAPPPRGDGDALASVIRVTLPRGRRSARWAAC